MNSLPPTGYKNISDSHHKAKTEEQQAERQASVYDRTALPVTFKIKSKTMYIIRMAGYLPATHPVYLRLKIRQAVTDRTQCKSESGPFFKLLFFTAVLKQSLSECIYSYVNQCIVSGVCNTSGLVINAANGTFLLNLAHKYEDALILSAFEKELGKEGIVPLSEERNIDQNNVGIRLPEE